MPRGAVGPALLEAGGWLGLAAAAYALTLRFDEPLATYRLGAAAWPRALIVLLTVVALCQLGARLRQLRSARPAPAPAPRGPAGLRAALARLTAFALPLAYVVLLPRAGYYATTPFFLAAYMAVLGERRPRHLVGTALLVYGLVLLVFTRLFFVPLPVGHWPGFYEFGNWLLAIVR